MTEIFKAIVSIVTHDFDVFTLNNISEMVEVEQDTIGVDTPNDLELAKQIIEKQMRVKK